MFWRFALKFLLCFVDFAVSLVFAAILRHLCAFNRLPELLSPFFLSDTPAAAAGFPGVFINSCCLAFSASIISLNVVM